MEDKTPPKKVAAKTSEKVVKEPTEVAEVAEVTEVAEVAEVAKKPTFVEMLASARKISKNIAEQDKQAQS